MINIDIDLGSWWLVAVFVFDIVIRIAAIIIVPRNRRPTAAMAWLLAIYFIPVIGVVLFLVIGTPRLPRKRRRKQRAINEYIQQATTGLDHGTLRPGAPGWFTSLVRLNTNLGAMPLSGDNEAHLIADYQESLDAMADAIRGARRYVHVEFYILQADASTDNFFRALEEVSERGVTVRVLLDHWANRGKPFYRRTLKRLDAMGAQWHLMLPVQPLRGKYQRPDLRNHRKLLVIDGDIAFMGSQNVTDSTYNLRKNIRRGLHWVDLMVRLEGPVVGSVNAVFLSDWYSETDELLTEEVDEFDLRQATGDLDCQIVPSGPGFEFENNLRLFLGLMYAAKERIILVSPYFVPDESILNAITTACHRGVEVELFVSEEGDQAMVYHAQRSYYEVLLRAGVRIWMYRKPYILHTKAMTIDDEVAVIGSSNMDMRSFGLNMEISMLVRGEEFVEEMRQVEDHYRNLSTELTLEEWLRQPLRSTVLDNLARLTSALQ
ncbi:cardiolipin synthase [Microbacterium sp. SORGH_AS428]|uniref:cardiolipin synthase n=1 Tax=Microbacterium sp. SORGH_AS_0428 TaxID=3041788 RepID=UPI00285D2770|nr:cardiolipin synthase [Microbacterium sp. SORGH_AS_0428]MDR6200182.1 cardiolipin synthase [Microbacterium sp. SORGH_AS_0428]